MEKTILITGASTGIGKAAALYFAAQGWKVAATMRNRDAASEWAPRNANFLVLPLDVTNQAPIDAALAKVAEKLGLLGAL